MDRIEAHEGEIQAVVVGAGASRVTDGRLIPRTLRWHAEMGSVDFR